MDRRVASVPVLPAEFGSGQPSDRGGWSPCHAQPLQRRAPAGVAPPIGACPPTKPQSLPPSSPRAIDKAAACNWAAGCVFEHFRQAFRPPTCAPHRQCSACLATCTFPGGASSTEMASVRVRVQTARGPQYHCLKKCSTAAGMLPPMWTRQTNGCSGAQWPAVARC